MKKLSAGLLLYKIEEGVPKMLLVHPGGPFFAKKDDGAWSVPKGQADSEEERHDLITVARREFTEETGFEPGADLTYLGEVEREDGKKTVHIWMFEGDCDPAQVKSNMMEMEWPPKSGKKMQFPEIDRGAFFTIEEAKIKISAYQKPLIDMFEAKMRV